MQIGSRYKVISLVAPKTLTSHTLQKSSGHDIEQDLDDALAILQVGANVGDDNPTLTITIQGSKTTDTDGEYADIASFEAVAVSESTDRIAALSFNIGEYKFIRATSKIDDDESSSGESESESESAETAASYTYSLSVLVDSNINKGDLNSSDAGV